MTVTQASAHASWKRLVTLRAVERVAGLRVREDEARLARVGRALRPAIELGEHAVGHRHRSTRREVRLAAQRSAHRG